MPKRKEKIALLFIIVGLAVSLWFGQFRYSWNPLLEEDRYIGFSYAEVLDLLGPPASKRDITQEGYEMEPQSDFNQVVIYEPLWVKLVIYFKDGDCVGSVFVTNTLRFQVLHNHHNE